MTVKDSNVEKQKPPEPQTLPPQSQLDPARRMEIAGIYTEMLDDGSTEDEAAQEMKKRFGISDQDMKIVRAEVEKESEGGRGVGDSPSTKKTHKEEK
jgi:hypothetical protein